MLCDGRSPDLYIECFQLRLCFTDICLQRPHVILGILNYLFWNCTVGRDIAIPRHVMTNDIQSRLPSRQFLRKLPSVHIQCGDPSYSFAKVATRLTERGCSLIGIQRHDEFAFVDELGFLCQHIRDNAGHLGRDRHQVSCDEGIMRLHTQPLDLRGNKAMRRSRMY